MFPGFHLGCGCRERPTNKTELPPVFPEIPQSTMTKLKHDHILTNLEKMAYLKLHLTCQIG